MVTVLATTLPCSMKMTSLEYAGSARRRAFGSTIRVVRRHADMPYALAASTSPKGTASMAPRKISVV